MERERELQIREGLKCLQLSGAVFVRAHLTRPWAYHSPERSQLEKVLRPGDRRVILFHIFTEGGGRIILNDGRIDPTEIEAGDIVIFPFADQHTVGDPEPIDAVDLGEMIPPPPWSSLPEIHYGGGGSSTTILCGYLFSDDAPFNPVLGSLPPFIRVRSAGGPLAQWVESSMQYAMHASEGSTDDDPLLKRLPELLFMECLCEYARQQPDQRGWLGALSDSIVGRALGLMHQKPNHPWTLHELARSSASSRSTLDSRFRTFLGRAPMSYLIAYRLQLAGRQLRSTNATMTEIADFVGYGSEAAFSRAFTRHTGVSPSEWRQGATLRPRARS